MNVHAWLEDRRWRWRIVVLVLLLAVIGALIWRGYDPLAAVGTAFMIFVVAAPVVELIVDRSASGQSITVHHPGAAHLPTAVTEPGRDAPTDRRQTFAGGPPAASDDPTTRESP